MTFSDLAAVADSPPPVDLILVLLVDVSGSVAGPALALQRESYVAALADPELAEAVSIGPRRAIAVVYVEWAGPDHQEVILPCTVVATRDDARRLSRDLAARKPSHGHGTSISAALLFALSIAKTCSAASPRLIIDVSGNGPNNAGPEILAARDTVVATGATINGLPIALPAQTSATEHFGRDWLDAYYQNCVSGGPGGFVLSVDDPWALRTSILRKLVLEIALGQERVWAARATRRAPFDCHLIGQTPGR